MAKKTKKPKPVAWHNPLNCKHWIDEACDETFVIEKLPIRVKA